MTTEYSEGFAEGFKAGWEAAQKQLLPPPVNPYEYQPTNPVTSHDLGWGRPTVGRPVLRDPRLNVAVDAPDVNPWTAHNGGRGIMTEHEQEHFEGQITGLNLHTTTPEYDEEDRRMHGTTRVY